MFETHLYTEVSPPMPIPSLIMLLRATTPIRFAFVR